MGTVQATRATDKKDEVCYRGTVGLQDDLNKIRQEIALIRGFADVTPTLGFNEDEACGLAWILDSWMERIDKAVDTLKQG